jgi:hypothetical protein
MIKKTPGKPSPPTRKAARKSSAPTKAGAAAPKRIAKPVSDPDKATPVTTKPRKPTAARATVSKPAAKAKHVAAVDALDTLDAFIAATATALDLPVEPAWLPAIKANLEVTLRLGSQITTFELPDEAEPAPIFGA